MQDAPNQNNFIDGTITSQRNLEPLVVGCLRRRSLYLISVLPQASFGA
jgi:hypothetical protein